MFPSHSNCTECALHSSGCTSVGVPSIWDKLSLPPSPSIPAVVFIGINPGRQEDAANEPFVGPSGIILRGNASPTKPMQGVYVDGVGLRSRASVYLSNGARCYNPAAPSGVCTIHEMRKCWPHTESDLALISSVHTSLHLVALGALPTSLITERYLGKSLAIGKAIRLNGSTTSILNKTWHIYFTFHPSYLLRRRSPSHVRSVSEHLQILSDRLSGIHPTVTRPTLIPPSFPE